LLAKPNQRAVEVFVRKVLEQRGKFFLGPSEKLLAC